MSQLRRATAADVAAICALQAEEGDAAPSDPAVNRWLYWDNPFGTGHSVVWEEDGVVVAHAGLHCEPGRIEGRAVRVGLLTDVVTARAQRGRGLTGRLIRRLLHALDDQPDAGGVDLVVSVPTPASLPVLEGTTVMRRDRAQRFVRPIGPALGDIGLLNRAFATALSRAAFGPPPEPAAEVVTALPDDVDQLAASAPGDGVLAAEAWWRWRVLDHPVHRYQLVAQTREGRTTGLAAIRTHTSMGVEVLDVIHLMAVDAAAAGAVLGTAIAANPGAAAATMLATAGSQQAGWARETGMWALPTVADWTSGSIALVGSTTRRTSLPARRWDVSLASHPER